MVLKCVALTGASGMVGRHTIAELLSRGIEIVATSRTKPTFLPKGVIWKSWDLREWKSSADLDNLFGSVDAILHIGCSVSQPDLAPDEAILIATNVSACRCLGNWAIEKNIPLAYLSGAIVYDPSSIPPIDESSVRTSTPEGGFYGLTKVLAEQVFENLVPEGLKLSILRASSIYGWGLDQEKMLQRMLTTAYSKKTIFVMQPTMDQINLIHASDVARALTDVLNSQQKGIFNIGGESKTILEIAESCIKAAKAGNIVINTKPPNRAASKRFIIDYSKAADCFGFEPRTDLIEGIERMLKCHV